MANKVEINPNGLTRGNVEEAEKAVNEAEKYGGNINKAKGNLKNCSEKTLNKVCEAIKGKAGEGKNYTNPDREK